MTTPRSDKWMPLYIGDYHKDTARLTTLQHGAYLLLIMDYWVAGPPPDDDEQLASVAKLSVKEWRKIRPALEAKFQIHDGAWHHKRIDAELLRAAAKTEQKSAAGKASAQRRWNGRDNGGVTDVTTGSPTEPQRDDAPSPSDLSPSGESGGAPKGASARGSRLPEDFTVPEEWKREADAYRSVAKLPPVDLDTEAIKFTNFFLSAAGAKGRKSNWKRAFINWILNARPSSNGNGSHPVKETADERTQRRRAGLAAAVMAGDVGSSRAGAGFGGPDLAGDGGGGAGGDSGEPEVRGGDAGPDPRASRAA